MSDPLDADLDPTATDYEVGYRKPPAAHRFQPGRSGNPKGRPKRPSMNGAFDRVAERKLTVREGGRRRKLTLAEAIFLDIGQKALKGERGAQHDFIKLAIARGISAVDSVPTSQLPAPVVFAAVFPNEEGEGGS